MAWLRNISLLGAMLSLHACFVSTEPLIPLGEGIQLSTAPIQICTPTDPCMDAVWEGDGYTLYPPEDSNDGPVPVRFQPLTESDLGMVYLAEIRMVADEAEADVEWSFMYGVTRHWGTSEAGADKFLLVQPDCQEASAEQLTAYTIEQIDTYSCGVMHLEDLSAYLIEAHGADFDNPQWWEETY